MDMKITFDPQIVAQKIISCVVRVRESVGITQTARILTGSKAQSIIQHEYDKLPTYNIVTEYTWEQVAVIIEQMVDKNYLSVTSARIPLLRLTALSKAIINNSLQAELTPPPSQTDLFWQRMEQLSKKPLSPSVLSTIQLLVQGKRVTEIATVKKVMPDTILSHITEAYIQGVHINIASLVSADSQQYIRELFKTHGIERLTPIKELVGDQYSYNDLRVVQALMIKEKLSHETLS